MPMPTWDWVADCLPSLLKFVQGDTVIDLGSGAGNDCFVARAETGVNGKVIGIDFTTAMIEKARANADKLGISIMLSSARVILKKCRLLPIWLM